MLRWVLFSDKEEYTKEYYADERCTRIAVDGIDGKEEWMEDEMDERWKRKKKRRGSRGGLLCSFVHQQVLLPVVVMIARKGRKASRQQFEEGTKGQLRKEHSTMVREGASIVFYFY